MTSVRSSYWSSEPIVLLTNGGGIGILEPGQSMSRFHAALRKAERRHEKRLLVAPSPHKLAVVQAKFKDDEPQQEPAALVTRRPGVFRRFVSALSR
jgi:hypothetical protein